MAEQVQDIVIIGGGPAGLTAGIYAARGRMKTVLVESLSVMGQATMTGKIENYPGIDSVGGYKLINDFKQQGEKFGLVCAQDTVKKIIREEGEGMPFWNVECEGSSYSALAVVIASGAQPKKLDVPGEKEFTGRGISYCAICDAMFFKDKDIVVVGGGDTAVEEAIFLTKFGRKVMIIHRRDRFRATSILKERAVANEKLSFVWDSVVEEVAGGDKVEGVKIRNVKTGATSEIACEGAFIFVGWTPNTDFARGVIDIDDKQCILVDNEMKTSAPGIFAGGDCCHKLLHQIVTACGDGATAVFSAQHYVEELKGVAYK
ncbi:MAG: thioredoxin-disulfide reductase [Candidatus Tantalella remota]|nr:thioredoxin-disulfide reductase [Candidatus Tantalella remota]